MAVRLEYEYYESVDSTNDEIKRRLAAYAADPREQLPPEGLVISAGMQTAGRGRSGHSWSSPAGASVATSLLLIPAGLSPVLLPQLTIVAAVAVSSTIEGFARSVRTSGSDTAGSFGDGGVSVAIKWPNDILLDEKKVSGILVERLPGADGSAAVIVGIGVNLIDKAYPAELSGKAVSIKEALGIDIDGQAVVRGIWERFCGLYEEFAAAGGLSAVIDYYNKHLYNRGRQVRVLDPAGEYIGTAVETDSNGRLLVRCADGVERLIDSGEVSVRGIDGYV